VSVCPLTYHGKLTLSDLEAMISPSRTSRHPVELLTLSACETAAGDDRAALGLAGVAVKSGARTAVATLWCVSDQASAQLIQAFYEAMRENPALSKAKAMQLAQVRLCTKPGYRHPYYWAPYLVIGNWL
jgi:CHAT domain-containing protein